MSRPALKGELPAAPGPTPGNWHDALARRGDGYVGDERNVLIALRHAPELLRLVRFDEFSLRAELTRAPPWRTAAASDPWTDADDTALKAWLQDQGVQVRQSVADCIALVAKDASYHPVREYLGGLEWDGEPRLQTWLAEYLNAQADPVYLAAVGCKFLISAIARIMNPGCQVDYVLVLEGPQGIGKSRTARTLAVRPAWFTDDMPDIHRKDAALQVCGRWICELAELAALRRGAEVEGMKAFLSRPVDVFRPPYGRRAVTVPRQNVFVGTTNEAHYLRDPTGNRRFWPVRCERIDLKALERDRDQLWAEAVQAFRKSEAWHMTDAETELARAEQQERVLVTELEATVAEYLTNLADAGIKEVSAKQVMVDALHLEPDKADFAERAGRLGVQVSTAMQAAGWTKLRTSGRSPNRRTIYRYTGESL
ncbi:MAG: virulence-associated E family protein [Steroidobacteraceae bacterium]